MRSCWYRLIGDELADNGESWSDIISITLTEEKLRKKFDAGYGVIEGVDFTAWTKNRVYFPTDYDGAEGVGSVSRNPDGNPTRHQGGGG